MKSKKSKRANSLEIFGSDSSNPNLVPISDARIPAGFPSPADDFKETRISLDKTLINNEDATFYARVSGKSMINAGLDDGDLLVIDRSLEPENGKIAVCFIDGEFTVKRLQIKKDEIYLIPENEAYQPIKVNEGSNLIIWGIVTYVIKAL